MIKGKAYDTQVDLWSLGVLLYYLMCGHMAFPAETQDELFEKIRIGKFHYDHKEFNLVSDECKDLINNLLVLNPKKRLTAAKALNHPWFEKFSEKKSISVDVDRLEADVLHRLKSYKGQSYFKKAAMNLLVKISTPQELEGAAAVFKGIDKDQSGLISIDEMKAFLKKQNMNYSDREVSEMFEELDYHGNGKINYSEFLMATMDTNNFLRDTKLRCVFSMFDLKGNNKITPEEMKFAFEKLGQQVPYSEIKEMVAQHDVGKDGYITFPEFKLMFENFR